MSTHKTGNDLNGQIIPNGTVTQICNLLYRRFSTCRTGNAGSVTAWKSAARGFSLVEMMVAVAVMAMIMVALLAMFSQATRALRSANNQTDILESGRAVMDMIGRELQQASAQGGTNTLNFYSQNISPGLTQNLPGGEQRKNEMGMFFFVTQENTLWNGIGYTVVTNSGGYGTLFRYQTNGPVEKVFLFGQAFLNANQNPNTLHQVAEGIMHFKITPYDQTGSQNFTNPNVKVNSTAFQFSMDALPAFVEIELGVLEPPVLKRIKNMSNSDAMLFLANEQRTASVHLFRQRVAIIAGGAR